MYGENYILLGIRRMKNKKKQASRLDLPVFFGFHQREYLRIQRALIY